MLDIVRNHPTAVNADAEFGYNVKGEKVFALDDLRNILDLKTGKKTGQSLIPTSLVNTPGYEVNSVPQ